MIELRYTLLSDGSSDRVLIPILSWALREQNVLAALTAEWADLRMLRNPPQRLEDRIKAALDLYPCNLLFVHRDAEAETIANRRAEIQESLVRVFEDEPPQPAVCVVPRRMAEAWLLIEEAAIRSASGNPRGTAALALPPPNRIEDIPDPKGLLRNLIGTASEHGGRRLRSLPVRQLFHRVSELLTSFNRLRNLPAFVAFEQELAEVVAEEGWAQGSVATPND